MTLQRILGIVLLLGGAAFLYFGLRATDSVAESVTEGLTGKYTGRTTWYLVGGGIAMVVGAGFAWFGGGPRSA